MREHFDQALAFLIDKSEGHKYTNDPKDSGGPTKYGVTLKLYAAFLKRDVTPAEIEALTIDKVKPFYLSRYWIPLAGDRLKSAVIATCLFDSAVLYGQGTTARLAQKALIRCGVPLKSDGVLGDKSIDAINESNPEEFLKSFCDLLLGRINMVIEQNPKNEKFRDGWTNRVSRLLTLGANAPLNSRVT